MSATFVRQYCVGTGVLLLGLGAGCATTSDPFAVEVTADLKVAAASPAAKKYTIVYSDESAETLLQPLSPRLDATLVQLGYEDVPPPEAMVIVYVVAQKDQPGVITREMTAQEAGEPMNPDSIRFKNFAATTGGGRYSGLLFDNPNAPGDIMLGPEGELIATGNARKPSDTDPRPDKKEIRVINRLLLCAMETPLPADAVDIKIRWRVEVISSVEPGKPVPAMDHLLRIALEHLATKSHGEKRR